MKTMRPGDGRSGDLVMGSGGDSVMGSAGAGEIFFYSSPGLLPFEFSASANRIFCKPTEITGALSNI